MASLGILSIFWIYILTNFMPTTEILSNMNYLFQIIGLNENSTVLQDSEYLESFDFRSFAIIELIIWLCLLIGASEKMPSLILPWLMTHASMILVSLQLTDSIKINRLVYNARMY